MEYADSSAGIGFARWRSVEELPLTRLEKEAVLELFAMHLWKILEEGSGDPDYYHKSYDPLVIEDNEAHSYVFRLSEQGGRHHPFETLEELEGKLIEDAIDRIQQMLEMEKR